MLIYWTLHSLPEMQLLSSDERHEVIHRWLCRGGWILTGEVGLLLLPPYAIAVGTAGSVALALGGLLPFSVVVVALLFVVWQLLLRYMRGELRDEIHDLFPDAPYWFCRRCGYCLLGHTTTACPECGCRSNLP